MARHCANSQKVIGQRAPRAPGPFNIQHRAKHIAKIGLSGLTDLTDRRHQRHYQRSLRVSCIACTFAAAAFMSMTGEFDQSH
jgi:hypothetical protein